MCAAVPDQQLGIVLKEAAAEAILLAAKPSTISSPTTSCRDIERHVH